MTRHSLQHLIFPALLLSVLGCFPVLRAQGLKSQADRDKILQFVRKRYEIPATSKITMTDLRETIFPDFFQTTITVDDGKQKHSLPFFVSRNMRYMVQGAISNLGGDSRETVLRLISLRNQPSQGPANAPVTLVEYSDLQCPVCARMHQELETQIVPKYGNKLRVVFKEFPLVTIHDWAMTGAIAAQCAYQIDPSRYVAFRSKVYENQPTITADQARDLLLHYGAEAGIDDNKLAACIDSKASLPRVEANMNEGEALGIAQTPTSYVNGRIVIGAVPMAELDKVIDQALRATAR